MQKVSDALEFIGTILPSYTHTRDAVHVAVIPARAEDRLKPGQPVGYGRGVALAGADALHIGIVDPFLGPAGVEPNQYFYIFLFPRTITGLSHIWTHPDLPDLGEPREQLPSEAEDVLRSQARSLGLSLERMVDLATNYNNNSTCHYTGEEEMYLDNPDAFWEAWEMYTGMKITLRVKENQEFFRCAC